MSAIVIDEEEETETHTWDQAHEIDPNWDYDGEAHRGGTGYPSGGTFIWMAVGVLVIIAAIVIWILA